MSLHRELEEGTVVLVFCPADFGAVCSIEMTDFKNVRTEIESMDYRDLWTSGGKVSRLYGVFIEEDGFLRNFTNRAMKVIRRDGCIRAGGWPRSPTTSSPLSELLASL